MTTSEFDYRDNFRDFLLSYENFRQRRIKSIRKKCPENYLRIVSNYISLRFRSQDYRSVVGLLSATFNVREGHSVYPTLRHFYVRALFRANRERVVRERAAFLKRRNGCPLRRQITTVILFSELPFHGETPFNSL